MMLPMVAAILIIGLGVGNPAVPIRAMHITVGIQYAADAAACWFAVDTLDPDKNECCCSFKLYTSPCHYRVRTFLEVPSF